MTGLDATAARDVGLAGDKGKAMQTVTMPYQWFVDRCFRDFSPVRGFGLWQVYSAKQYQDPLLLLVNETEEVVIKCRYESWEECAEDIDLLRRIPPGGEASAGVLAALNPAPPVLSAGSARPLPKPGSGPEPPAT